MSTHTGSTSVRKEITVDAPVAEAFRVFTERLGDIKPREHNLLATDIAETVLEPRDGGAIYDRGVDGSECHWATVLAFEPPRRLLFSWNIGPTWQLETDPDRRSLVEITFAPQGDAHTRVVLEHRHIDRHGSGWEGVREGVDGGAGWPLYLERYAALVASG